MFSSATILETQASCSCSHCHMWTPEEDREWLTASEIWHIWKFPSHSWWVSPRLVSPCWKHISTWTRTKLNWQEKKGREQVLGAHGVLETGMRLSRQSWWVQEKVERDEERKHSPEHSYSQIQSLLAWENDSILQTVWGLEGASTLSFTQRYLHVALFSILHWDYHAFSQRIQDYQ